MHFLIYSNKSFTLPNILIQSHLGLLYYSNLLSFPSCITEGTYTNSHLPWHSSKMMLLCIGFNFSCTVLFILYSLASFSLQMSVGQSCQWSASLKEQPHYSEEYHFTVLQVPSLLTVYYFSEMHIISVLWNYAK